MGEKAPSKKAGKKTAKASTKSAAKAARKPTAAVREESAGIAVEEVAETATVSTPAQEPQGLEAAARRVLGQVRDTAKSLAHDAAELVRNRPWQPPVDVLMQGDEIILKADLPGVEPAAVEIAVTPNSVVLRGVRPAEAALKEEESGGAVVYEIQRRSGVFQREVSLPHPVDSGSIVARMSRGVLEVRMPLSAEKTVKPS